MAEPDLSQPVKIAIAGANGRMGQAVAKALEGRADAIVAAVWVKGKPPGLYDMQDVLGFSK
jgi:dihydrodipicolinate reductase